MTEPIAEIEVPHSSFRGLVTPEEMRRLCQPATWRVVRDLSLIWLQLVGAVGLYLWRPSGWSFALAFVLVAGGQHGLMLATHEFAHYSLFPTRRKLNDLLGTWLFGAPAGIPLSVYRHRHFRHHRHYSTDADPKTAYRHDLRGRGLLREAARSLSGYEFACHAFEARRQEARESAAGRPGPSPLHALPPLIVAQAVLLAAFSAVASPWVYVTLWLLPLLTLSELFQKLRACMEHRPLEEDRGLEPEAGFYAGTPGPFVRSVRATWWERLTLCKLNFGFHAEHHLWPQVSYQHLPGLRSRLEAAGAFRDPRFGRESSYTAAIWKLWRGERPPRLARGSA